MSTETKNKNTEEKEAGNRFAETPESDSGFAAKFIPRSSDSGAVKARKIVILTVIIALLAVLVYFIVYLITDKSDSEADAQATETQTQVITETTAETTVTTVPVTETETEPTTTTPPPEPLVMLDSMTDYYNQNNDTAGWLKMDGTAINSVVVQGEDNDFYLDHNFYGNSSAAGSLYVDYRCILNDYDFNQSDNIIIYGHNQADGSMFGTLQYYKIKKSNTSNFSFYQEHPTFTFSNLYEEYTYKIIAMFISEASESQARDGLIFDAHNFVRFNPDPAEKRSFANFEKNINERTAVLTGVDFEEGDQFMTLSTCSNEFDNSRFIVIGRKVRDGESPEVDTSLAQLNPDAKEPDLDFIYYGN